MRRKAGLKGAFKKFLEVLGVIFLLLFAIGAYTVYEENKNPSGKVYTQKEVLQGWVNARVKYALNHDIEIDFTIYRDTSNPGHYNPKLDRAIARGAGWAFLNVTVERYKLFKFAYVPKLTNGTDISSLQFENFTAKNLYDELHKLANSKGLPLNAVFVLEPNDGTGANGYYGIVNITLSRNWIG
ncbi:hypothetical protein [Thermococcus henrietii]|uniref:hypothetical protein n=1 Tax=Thermococcus henrietii TaxID=2016361 RepID=UPI000C070CD7|nr:hypothetical protein [Thermococcus henrietii]